MTRIRDDGPTLRRSFDRRLGSLPEMVEFAAGALVDCDIDSARRLAIDLAIEELFTNMLKYSPSGVNPVEISFEFGDASVEVSLSDIDVEPFDVTAAPDADVTLPLQQRQPGGLGLHLTRRLVDDLSYEYLAARRESRIRFRVACRRRT
jgi:serine/threonine-protein kinase RsbW